MILHYWTLLAPLLYFFIAVHPTHAYICPPRVSTVSFSSVSSSSLASSSRPVIEWAKQQTLQELVPKDDAYKIINELVNNKELIDSTEESLEANRESLEKRIQEEDRSVSQILGPTTTNRVLTSIANVQYDKEVVSTFLNSDAINSLFARVLCTSNHAAVYLHLCDSRFSLFIVHFHDRRCYSRIYATHGYLWQYHKHTSHHRTHA